MLEAATEALKQEEASKETEAGNATEEKTEISGDTKVEKVEDRKPEE